MEDFYKVHSIPDENIKHKKGAKSFWEFRMSLHSTWSWADPSYGLDCLAEEIFLDKVFQKEYKAILAF